MAGSLAGKKVAFLVDEGVDEAERSAPWQAVEQAGGTPDSVVAARVRDADPADYAGLVLLGGGAEPSRDTEQEVLAFARRFFEDGKPVGSLGLGARTLVGADVVRGRTLTSASSLQGDIGDAGGTWVDQEVAIDAGLVSSPGTGDLRAFCRALVDEIAAGDDAGQAAHRPTGTG